MAIIISSRNNNLFKKILSLKNKKNRDRESLFLIEGKKFVLEAQKCSMVKNIIVSETYFKNNKNDLFNLEEKIVFSDYIFEMISDTENTQGIVALCEKNKIDIDNIFKENNIIILNNINDPGNLGCIIRNCVAFDVGVIIISKGSVDLYNPKVLRASAGNIFKIKIFCEVNITKILSKLKHAGFYIYATYLSSNNYIHTIKFKLKKVIIFGNESNGVSNDLIDFIDETIKIKTNSVESLNLAVSSGIILNQIFNSR
ncbi:MAG: RNA methyltransferase [Clostridiales bacterium]|jgi:TrmH family RNA methyltransferase|nr:RNA methyltransferase [Clostridiales bacterium]